MRHGLALLRSGELRRAFWGRSVHDWADLMAADGAKFRRIWGGQIGPNARPFVIAYAYLIGEFSPFDRLGQVTRPNLARRALGGELADAAIQQICTVLAGWGYRRDAAKLAAAICHDLLLNRSPRLEDLSTEALATLRESPATSSQWGTDLHGIHRGVAALGRADSPPFVHEAGPAATEGVEGVAAWAGWVECWYATSALTPKIRRRYRSVLAKIGRRLAAQHPEITEPAQWTRQTCATWVAAVDRMAVGDVSQWTHGMHSQGRLGKPLAAESKSGYLKVPRAFCRDLYEWEWIQRRFDPSHALRTHRGVRALMGPDPRVIADDIWARLLWAGLNVEPGELPTADGRTYPVELIRANTLTSPGVGSPSCRQRMQLLRPQRPHRRSPRRLRCRRLRRRGRRGALAVLRLRPRLVHLHLLRTVPASDGLRALRLLHAQGLQQGPTTGDEGEPAKDARGHPAYRR